MKKAVLFTIAVFCYAVTFSQTFNYQAAVRNAGGDLITNQSVGVRVRILEGSPTGTVLFNETHTVTSNAHGIVSLPIGGGTVDGNFTSFHSISWNQANKWIDIWVDVTGGTSYVQLGTSELRFVPYALYAVNSGNAANANHVFGITGDVVSNESGNNFTNDFVFGSSQLDNNGSFNPAFGNRMFFDKSKAAFRAGYTSQEQWDEANVGDYSVGFGEGGIASGSNSFSMGRNANATGNHAIAFGLNAGGFADYARGFGLTARAFGQHSTAMGRQVIANSMAEIQLGQYSNFVSGSPNTWVPTDRLFVIGNGEEDINLAKNSDALVMLKNGNTTLHGALTIDGDNVGGASGFTLPAQDGTLNQIMQTDGAGQVSWVTPAADAIPNGGTNGYVLSTDGTGVLSWVNNDILPTGGTDGFVLKTDGSGNYAWVTNEDNDTDATNEIELPTGGADGQVLKTDGSGSYAWVDQTATAAFSTTGNVTSNAPGTISTDDFVFGSTQLDNVSGADDNSRMFFDKSRGAFRAGNDVDGFAGMNEANIGPFSVGFGQRNVASGFYSSTLGGQRNTSSGWYSMTMGDNNTASGTYATALGRDNNASGVESVALGYNLTAETRGQTTLGQFNTPVAGNAGAHVLTDRLLVVGNGVSDFNGTTRSDALVILKNGNTSLNGTLTIDGDNQGIETGYTFPAQDGTANQIMSTDGSGVVSWIDAPSGSGATLPAGGNDGDVLKTDGTGNYAWISNNDGDSDATNEIELPTQTGQSGKMLSTDGTSPSWVDAPSTLPSQTGESGKILTTDGINASWVADAVNDADSDPTNEIELPTQTGNSGKMLSTDGTSPSWVDAPSTLPSQTGESGKVLTTDGTNASWITDAVDDADNDPTNEIELPTQTGQSGKILSTNGTATTWIDTPTELPSGGTTGQVLKSDGSGGFTWSSDIEATSVKIASLPAFNVTSNATAYTSAGAKEVGNWNSSVNADLFNDGSHLNITNGRFTAPVDGLYFFSAQVRIDGLNGASGSNYSRLMIVKNSTKNFQNGLHSIRNADAGTAFYDTQHVSGILKLNAGDYVSVYVETTGDTSFTLQVESGFNGYLVNKL